MIKGHAIEPHFEQLIHRQLAAGIGEAHDHAVHISFTDDGRNVWNRANDPWIEHALADTSRIWIHESDDLDAERLAMIVELPGELDRGSICSDQQQAFAGRCLTTKPLEKEPEGRRAAEHEDRGDQEDAAADHQRRKPEIQRR